MGGVVGAQAPQSGGAGTGKFGGMANQGGGANPFQQFQAGQGLQQVGQQTQQQQPFQNTFQQQPFQGQQPDYAALFRNFASMFGNQQIAAPRSNYSPAQSANNFQLRNTYQFNPATDPSRQYAARVKAEADQKAADAEAAKAAADAAAQSQTQQTSYEMGSPGNARGGRINSPDKKIRAALLTAKGVQAKAVPEKAGGGDVASGAPITAYHTTYEPFEEYDWSRLGEGTQVNTTDDDPDSWAMTLAKIGPWAHQYPLNKQMGYNTAMPVFISGKGKAFNSLDSLHAAVKKIGGVEPFRKSLLNKGFEHVVVKDEEFGKNKSYVALHPGAFTIKRAGDAPGKSGGGALAAPGAFEEDGGRVGYGTGGGEDDPVVQKALGLTQGSMLPPIGSELNHGDTYVGQNAPTHSEAGSQAGELPFGRSLPGGEGVVPSSHQAPLEGLPSRVKIPSTGEVITAGPNHLIRAVSEKYMRDVGLPYNPPKKYAKVDMARAKRLSDEYDRMADDPDHPLVKAAYDALARETMAQYQAAKAAGFKAEFWDPGKEKDPYEASPRLVTEDVNKNHHMYVFPTHFGYGSEEISPEDRKRNPLLADSGERWNGHIVTVNDIFRAVHDYFGHAKEGVGFRHDGEENAWRSHASMYSPLARLALTSETRGQNSWVNFGKHGENNRKASSEDTVYAPQKVGIMPAWTAHEGAEDFLSPEDKTAMEKIHKQYRRSSGGRIGYGTGGGEDDPTVQKALDITRRAVPAGSAKWSNVRSNRFEDLAQILESVRGTKLGSLISRYQAPESKQAVRSMYRDLLGLAREGEPGKEWYEKSSKRILDFVGGNKDEADKFAQLVAIYSPQTTVPVNTVNAIKAYNRAKAGHALWDGEIVDRDKSFKTTKEANDYIKSIGGSKAGYTKIPLDESGKRFLIARHGDPEKYENIATLDRDLKAHLVMNEGIPFEGRKINNFYNNLMVQIDPKRLQGSTQDLWMANAFGFLDPAIGGGAKYDFMERLTEKMAKALGWRPHQVQAAIWTAMKARQESILNEAKEDAVKQGLANFIPQPKGKSKFEVIEGNEGKFNELVRDKALGVIMNKKDIQNSARDFSDFLNQNLANISWESTPSNKIAHLAGFDDLSPEKKADYHARITGALQDDDGIDHLAKFLGIMSPGSVPAHGYWEGITNPATHTMVASTRVKAAGQRPDIDTPSKDLMDIYSNALGLILKQDGVGYHRPFYNPKISEANGSEFEFKNQDGTPYDLTHEDIKHLGDRATALHPDLTLVPVGGNKVRFLNFAPTGEGGTFKNHQDFHKAASSLVQSLPKNVVSENKVFAFDGGVHTNNWREDKNGESYIQRLGASGRPDVLRFISSVLAPRIQAVDQQFAQEHGLQRDEALENSLRNISPPAQNITPLQGMASPSLPFGGQNPLKAEGGSIIDRALQLTASMRHRG